MLESFLPKRSNESAQEKVHDMCTKITSFLGDLARPPSRLSFNAKPEQCHVRSHLQANANKSSILPREFLDGQTCDAKSVAQWQMARKDRASLRATQRELIVFRIDAEQTCHHFSWLYRHLFQQRRTRRAIVVDTTIRKLSIFRKWRPSTPGRRNAPRVFSCY